MLEAGWKENKGLEEFFAFEASKSKVWSWVTRAPSLGVHLISDTFLTLMIRSAVFFETCKIFFFYSFFRVPERVFVQDPRGSPPPKAQKCQRLLKEAHTAKHWPERREPSQFANEKTVKTVPVVAPSSSQWREREREGKLFTSWVIFVLGMTQKSKEVMKMTQSVNPVIQRTIQMAIRNRTVLTVLR